VPNQTGRSGRHSNYDNPRIGALALAVAAAHPRHTVGIVMGFTAACVIISNALFLQSGMHPAPLFANKPKAVALPEAPVAPPRPRVVEMTPTQVAPAPVVMPVARPSAAKNALPARNDPIAELISMPRDTAISPPASVQPSAQPVSAPAAPSVATGSKRLLAVQRALADMGYGQVKLTGTMGPDTQAAIESFERDRKLPVTGQLSERTLRELAAFSGRSLYR
jgi:hypothetical protein